ncbi:hypothetical protein [Flavobacterium sp.]|uniref:hypothetical protein n=1 Tax=Flavobacterium sp. TaxID=239 RepID=UPI003BD223A3
MSLDTLIRRTPSRLVSDSPATGRRTSSNGNATDLSGQSISAVLGNGLVGKLVATGGTESTVGIYKYHVFTSSGTLVITNGGGLVEIAAVAGGYGGAGGSAFQGQPLNVKYGRNLKIVVGAPVAGGHSYVTTDELLSGEVYGLNTRIAFSFSDARSISINGHAASYGYGQNGANCTAACGCYGNCQLGGGGPGAVSNGGGGAWGSGRNGGAGLTLSDGWQTAFGRSDVGGGGGGSSYGENNCDCGVCGGFGYGAGSCGGQGYQGSERGCYNGGATAPTGTYGCGGDTWGAHAGTSGAVAVRYLA